MGNKDEDQVIEEYSWALRYLTTDEVRNMDLYYHIYSPPEGPRHDHH
jgi:hypothetical protein